jgi:transcriptional regulator with XRE-family HTH domain
MTRTAKAIKALRGKLGLSQAAFAEELGTTITTVSRYENGRIEPSEEALRKLADLAASTGLVDLRDFFENQRKVGILARVEKLPSPGTQRRVSVDELSSWYAHIGFLHDDLLKLEARPDQIRMPEAHSTEREWAEWLLQIKNAQIEISDKLLAAANMLKLLQAEIYPYLPASYAPLETP